jgi:hypothetical protein
MPVIRFFPRIPFLMGFEEICEVGFGHGVWKNIMIFADTAFFKLGVCEMMIVNFLVGCKDF